MEVFNGIDIYIYLTCLFICSLNLAHTNISLPGMFARPFSHLHYVLKFESISRSNKNITKNISVDSQLHVHEDNMLHKGHPDVIIYTFIVKKITFP